MLWFRLVEARLGCVDNMHKGYICWLIYRCGMAVVTDQVHFIEGWFILRCDEGVRDIFSNRIS
jgi:hypothetical protein